MKQVRLIFWKDVRHLWRELGLYAVLLAAFSWVAPQTWPGSAPDSFLALFQTLLKILLMASQFVLITRVVHEDGWWERSSSGSRGRTIGDRCWEPNCCLSWCVWCCRTC